MWIAVKNARRLFLGDRPTLVEPPDQPETMPLDDVVLALGRPELEHLIRALAVADGIGDRADTPDRLEAALSRAIAERTGSGSPHVVRSPAALHTPEAWQLRIIGLDAGTRAALEHAIRGGRFA